MRLPIFLLLVCVPVWFSGCSFSHTSAYEGDLDVPVRLSEDVRAYSHLLLGVQNKDKDHPEMKKVLSKALFRTLSRRTGFKSVRPYTKRQLSSVKGGKPLVLIVVIDDYSGPALMNSIKGKLEVHGRLIDPKNKRKPMGSFEAKATTDEGTQTVGNIKVSGYTPDNPTQLVASRVAKYVLNFLQGKDDED